MQLLLCAQHVVREALIQLLAQLQVRLLQLGKGPNLESILEVARDGLLQQLEVVIGELGHAVSEQAAGLAGRWAPYLAVLQY